MIRLEINGRTVETDVDPCVRLLDFLREDRGLIGTKEGCGKGECGACTVLLDGEAVDACLVLLGQCEGAAVTTIEGLGDGAHPLQKSMASLGAVQCGFCTPGLVLAAHALLTRCPEPSTEEVRRAVEGNLCRCTGYVKVEAAIFEAAREMSE